MEKENLWPEDLMVGDWVLLFDETPVRVDCVGNIEVYLTEPRGQHELDWHVTYEHIKPIPLTPEILEKNGFVLSEKSSSKPYQIRENSVYISVIVYKGRLNARYHERSNKPMNAMQIDCNYVHELQHALRLCGIDKEIVL